MIIPHDQLSTDALQGIIESFILQEGTDYGEMEVSFTEKVEQIKQQLNAGDIVIVYSELHETVNIMPKRVFIEQSNANDTM